MISYTYAALSACKKSMFLNSWVVFAVSCNKLVLINNFNKLGKFMIRLLVHLIYLYYTVVMTSLYNKKPRTKAGLLYIILIISVLNSSVCNGLFKCVSPSFRDGSSLQIKISICVYIVYIISCC